MTDAEKLAARDRLAFLTIRLHSLMKERWREELAGYDRERLLAIAASKIHESRLLSDELHKLKGFKERFGDNFSTAAFEVAAIRNTAFSDGEILALGAQAEVRSKNSAQAAKVKAERKEATFEEALSRYRITPTLLQMKSALSAARILIEVHGFKLSKDKLRRRISEERHKK